MADITVTKQFESRKRGSNRLPIANTVVLPYGSLVGAEAGFANRWAGGVNDLFMGIVNGGDDRLRDGVFTGNTSDTPDPHVRIDTSGPTLIGLNSVGGTPTQAKVGNQIYCTTSNTDDMTLDPAGTGIIQPIARLDEFRTSTDVDVRLYTPEEYAAHRGNTYILSFQLDLNTVAAQDVITDFAIPHRFKIVDWQFVTDIPGTAAKNATFTLEIGTTAVTGSVLLLDDNIGTQGIVIASTAITAANIGAAGDTLTMIAGTVTTFTAGTGTMCITVQSLGI